jgi:hypothetical protein
VASRVFFDLFIRRSEVGKRLFRFIIGKWLFRSAVEKCNDFSLWVNSPFPDNFAL